MTTIGQKIRTARKSMGFTLKEVSKRTGLSAGNLSEIENDHYSPSAKALMALSLLFNVPIDWILFDTQAPVHLGEPAAVYGSYEPIRQIYQSLKEEEKKKLLLYARLLEKGIKQGTGESQ